jgi:hypothetical protein
MTALRDRAQSPHDNEVLTLVQHALAGRPGRKLGRPASTRAGAAQTVPPPTH